MGRSQTGQLLLIGVPGPELDAATAADFREIQPGGFILFGRNIKSPAQLRKLIDDLRDLSEIEPIITIDQEGGRVSRLKLIGNEPPNAQQLRDRDDPGVDPAPRRHHRDGSCGFSASIWISAPCSIFRSTTMRIIRCAGAATEATSRR